MPPLLSVASSVTVASPTASAVTISRPSSRSMSPTSMTASSSTDAVIALISPSTSANTSFTSTASGSMRSSSCASTRMATVGATLTIVATKLDLTAAPCGSVAVSSISTSPGAMPMTPVMVRSKPVTANVTRSMPSPTASAVMTRLSSPSSESVKTPETSTTCGVTRSSVCGSSGTASSGAALTVMTVSTGVALPALSIAEMVKVAVPEARPTNVAISSSAPVNITSKTSSSLDAAEMPVIASPASGSVNRPSSAISAVAPTLMVLSAGNRIAKAASSASGPLFGPTVTLNVNDADAPSGSLAVNVMTTGSPSLVSATPANLMPSKPETVTVTLVSSLDIASTSKRSPSSSSK